MNTFNIAKTALTPLNLRSASFEKLDKEHFVKSYIHSQEKHRSYFAVEGKTQVLCDPADCGLRQTALSPSGRALENLDVSFATPILKPRVPKARSTLAAIPSATKDDGQINDHSRGLAAEASKFTEARRANDHTRSSDRKLVGHAHKETEKSKVDTRVADKEVYSRKSKPPTKYTEDPQEQTRPPYDPRKVATRTGRRKRDDSSEMDEEHAARLAERRSRKKTKRMIVKSAEVEEDDIRNASHSEEDLVDAKQRKMKKGKSKDIKAKIPTGLALMNAFSANNVGKNRLTLKPAVTSGVFKKGKASVKAVSIRKPAAMEKKANRKVFSEFEFLNRPPHRSEQQCTRSKPAASATSASEPESESDGSPSILQPQKGRKSKTKKQYQEPKESPDDPGATNQDTGFAPLTDTEEEAKQMTIADTVKGGRTADGHSRNQSEVWDIELEDRSLPSDATSVHSQRRSTQDDGVGTIVLTTYGATWRSLADSNKAPGFPAGSQEGLAAPANPERSSSLCPDQSASQVAQRISGQGNKLGSFIELSKYFAKPNLASERPSGTGKAEEHQASVVAASRFDGGGYQQASMAAGDLYSNQEKPASPAPPRSSESEECALPLDDGRFPLLLAPFDYGDYDAIAADKGHVKSSGYFVDPVLESPSSMMDSLDIALQEYADFEFTHPTGQAHLVSMNVTGDAYTPDIEMNAYYDDEPHLNTDSPDVAQADCGSPAMTDALLDDGLEERESYPLYDGYLSDCSQVQGFACEGAHDGSEWEGHEESKVAADSINQDNPPDYSNSNATFPQYLPGESGTLPEEDFGLVDGCSVVDIQDPEEDCAPLLLSTDDHLIVNATALCDPSYFTDFDTIHAIGPHTPTPQFCQGRALLLGLSEDVDARQMRRRSGVAQAEEDVAKSLKDHWFPQRL